MLTGLPFDSAYVISRSAFKLFGELPQRDAFVNVNTSMMLYVFLTEDIVNKFG